MIKNGQCIKYTNSNDIKKSFNTNHNVPKYIIKKTSKLELENETIPPIKSKSEKNELLSVLLFKKTL